MYLYKLLEIAYRECQVEKEESDEVISIEKAWFDTKQIFNNEAQIKRIFVSLLYTCFMYFQNQI